MPDLKIRPRVDTTGGFDALRNIKGELIHLTDSFEVGSIERGMASGKPSVALCFTLPNGDVVIAETSLELFAAAARALTVAHAP
jgi:hypothetical protein